MNMQPESIKSSKKKWIFIGVIVFIIAALGANIAIVKNKAIKTAENIKFASVTEKEITNTKLISGMIAPGKREMIYADTAKGKINEVYVKEGQKVKADQKLFSYQNPEITTQIKQNQIDRRMADTRYEQNQSKINFINEQIRDEKKKSKEQVTDPLQNEIQETQSQQTMTDLEAQLKDAEYQQRTIALELEKIKLQADDLQRKFADLVVYSSMEGLIQSVNKDSLNGSSQTAEVSNPIVQIIAEGDYLIEGTLTELQKMYIKPNQPITIRSKANTSGTWKGKITEVSEFPTSENGSAAEFSSSGQGTQNISHYNFKASVNSKEGLSSGYHVSIQVELPGTVSSAVRRTSIIKDEESQYVFVLDGKRLRRQQVATGVSNGDWVEVTEGLDFKDKVVLNPTSKVHDGMEVR